MDDKTPLSLSAAVGNLYDAMKQPIERPAFWLLDRMTAWLHRHPRVERWLS